MTPSIGVMLSMVVPDPQEAGWDRTDGVKFSVWRQTPPKYICTLARRVLAPLCYEPISRRRLAGSIPGRGSWYKLSSGGVK